MYSILYPDLDARLRDYRVPATAPEAKDDSLLPCVEVTTHRRSTHPIRPDHPMVVHAGMRARQRRREIEQMRRAEELARAAASHPRFRMPPLLAWLRGHLPARLLTPRTVADRRAPNVAPQTGPVPR